MKDAKTLFRLETKKLELVSFQVIPPLANTKEALPRAEESWSAYIDAFVNRIDANPKYLANSSPVFLSRTLRRAMTRSPSGIVERLSIRYRLECKICINTFRLLFVAGTEDLLYKEKKPLRTTN